MAMPEIDGGLVGGASLDPDDFARIVQFAGKLRSAATAGRFAPIRDDPEETLGADRTRSSSSIHVVASLILIVFILLHAGRGGGLSDMFGGAAAASMAGSTVVERTSTGSRSWSSLVFMFTTILLSLRLD